MRRASMACGWVSLNLFVLLLVSFGLLTRFLCWTVFSKCADYMDQGRRLENLSWRLWTRETFCVDPETSSDASVLPLLRSEAGDLPDLSSSVESAASDQADKIEHHIKRPKCDYKPAVVREDSMLNLGRGKEKHITSSGLERMVLNIKENKDLDPIPTMTTASPPVVDITSRLSTPTPTPPSNSTIKEAPSRLPLERQHPTQSTESCSTTAPENNDSDAAQQNASDTSVSSSSGMPVSRPQLFKSPSIVRGFSPSQVSSSYRSQPRLAPEPQKMNPPQRKPSPLKKKGGMFTLGGSSGDDDESSFDDRMVAQRTQRSSLSDELSKPKPVAPSSHKKVATFKDQVGTIDPPMKHGSRDSDEDAIETDDDISESAIDDDEDSDWEDSVTESGRSSVADNNNNNNQMFQRVDSRSNLVSRRSMLTMMMNQPNKIQNSNFRSSPALQRSRLTSPNGPSHPTSQPEDENLTMRSPDVPRSKPIIVRPSPQSLAHSPRTTRRNMLATELTESLRHHLLWERQQKSATANAFLKRRHTAHDVTNLQKFPGTKALHRGQTSPAMPHQSKDKDLSKINGSWTNYTDYGPWEYHAKGW